MYLYTYKTTEKRGVTLDSFDQDNRNRDYKLHSYKWDSLKNHVILSLDIDLSLNKFYLFFVYM